MKIEGEVALEIARSMIYPAAAAEFGKLTRALDEAGKSTVPPGMESLRKRAVLLGDKMDLLAHEEEGLAHALKGKHEGILLAMQKLRAVVDELEKFIPDSCWPLPKYREMLFIY